MEGNVEGNKHEEGMEAVDLVGGRVENLAW